MTPEPKTIEQRINELESAALIAENHNLEFARQIREQIKYLQQKLKDENAAITKLHTR